MPEPKDLARENAWLRELLELVADDLDATAHKPDPDRLRARAKRIRQRLVEGPPPGYQPRPHPGRPTELELEEMQERATNEGRGDAERWIAELDADAHGAEDPRMAQAELLRLLADAVAPEGARQGAVLEQAMGVGVMCRRFRVQPGNDLTVALGCYSEGFEARVREEMDRRSESGGGR